MKTTRFNFIVFFAVIAYLLFFSIALCRTGTENYELQSNKHANNTMTHYKGFNIDHTLKEQDFVDLRRMGVSVVRASFPRQPFLDKSPPYAVRKQAIENLDRYISMARKYQVRLIIDPHVFPGMKGLYSTKPDDELWINPEIQAAIIKLWGEIAKRYAAYDDVIAGYDLLNEPSPPRTTLYWQDRCVFWNSFVKKMINEIRRYDNKHPIIVEFPIALNIAGKNTNQSDAASCLDVVNDINVIYSFHMYDPGHFTHQGILPLFKPPVFIYKNKDEEQVKNYLKNRMHQIRDYQLKHNIKIFVGEFGVSRYAGPEGDIYIKQLIEIFKEYGWGWAYHSFREAAVWDPELSVKDMKDNKRNSQSERMQIILRDIK